MRGFRYYILAIAALIIIPYSAFAFDECWEEPEWEYPLFVGYKTFNSDDLKDEFTIAFRIQKNLTDFFSSGFEIEYSPVDDASYIRGGIPVIVKLNPIKRLRFDAALTPGIVYFSDDRLSSSDTSFALNLGLEMKYFYAERYSLGLAVHGTHVPDSDLDSINIYLILGF